MTWAACLPRSVPAWIWCRSISPAVMMDSCPHFFCSRPERVPFPDPGQPTIKRRICACARRCVAPWATATASAAVLAAASEELCTLRNVASAEDAGGSALTTAGRKRGACPVRTKDGTQEAKKLDRTAGRSSGTAGRIDKGRDVRRRDESARRCRW